MAEGIIGDAEAAAIADQMTAWRMGVTNGTQDDLRNLAIDGRIGGALFAAAPVGQSHPFEDLQALCTYVRFHGERGPVDGWPSGSGEDRQ